MEEAEWEKIPKEFRERMGAWKTLHGECELGKANPMACMFCSFGHMTECHYPHTCEEAECSHYQREMEEEEIY